MNSKHTLRAYDNSQSSDISVRIEHLFGQTEFSQTLYHTLSIWRKVYEANVWTILSCYHKHGIIQLLLITNKTCTPVSEQHWEQVHWLLILWKWTPSLCHCYHCTPTHMTRALFKLILKYDIVFWQTTRYRVKFRRAKGSIHIAQVTMVRLSSTLRNYILKGSARTHIHKPKNYHLVQRSFDLYQPYQVILSNMDFPAKSVQQSKTDSS